MATERIRNLLEFSRAALYLGALPRLINNRGAFSEGSLKDIASL